MAVAIEIGELGLEAIDIGRIGRRQRRSIDVQPSGVSNIFEVPGICSTQIVEQPRSVGGHRTAMIGSQDVEIPVAIVVA